MRAHKRITDSTKELERDKKRRENDQELVEKAGALMLNDEKVAMAIIQKFNEFESDGESDKDDLQGRLDIFREH